VMFLVSVMERVVTDHRFLAWRARNKERVYCRFSWYYSIVLVLARLVVTVGPPITIFIGYEKVIVVTLFVCSI
jgi:hypothetical protein